MCRWGHLTKGHPSQSSTKLCHKMSLLGVWREGVQWDCWGIRGGALGGWGQEVHLTKDQPAQSSTKPGHEISLLWGGGQEWGHG